MKKYNDKMNWSNVTIDKYYKIVELCDDKALSYLDKNISIAALLLDIPEDDIWNMPIDESTELLKGLAFLNDFTVPKFNKKNIKLPNYECEIQADASKFTLAQYTDYQNFVKMPLQDGMYKMLSVMLVPKGFKYNDGYDIIDLQNEIKTNLLFVEGQSILDFFTHKHVESETHLLQSLAKKIVKEKDSMKKAEMMSSLYKMIQALKTICSTGYVSLNA